MRLKGEYAFFPVFIYCYPCHSLFLPIYLNSIYIIFRFGIS